MNNILLVEDNEDIQEINKDLLEEHGYTVCLAMNLKEARESISRLAPDLIVLDIQLPDGNGLDFLKELRDEKKSMPVLLLTASSESSTEIEGIQSGGDDFIAKPYNNEVLLARIEGLFRRAAKVPETILRGSLTLDTFSRRAFIDGEDLQLTSKEFDVLFVLVQNEGNLMTAPDIYEKVWSQPMFGDDNAVKTVISRLRPKIEPSGYGIDTFRGKGYMFTQV